MLKRTSTLTVPNDHGYTPAVLAYCARLATAAGFSEQEAEDISTALKEACENVIMHAFDPYEEESFNVTFDVTEDGMRITIDEMGMPFLIRLDDEGKKTPGFAAMEETMDSVIFSNKGRSGKELVMFKSRRGRHVEELFTSDELKPFDFCEIPDRDQPVELRLMRPEEAAQVSRCIYRAYRYTYLNEDLYFPERIIARNQDGSMISAVAVTRDHDVEGEVVAHFALKPRPHGKVAEIGVAVVIPRYRGRGLMKSLLEYLIKVAEERGLLALYGNAFTIHVASQKTNLSFGFSETALQIGTIPPRSIKPLTESDMKGAGSVMTFFKFLRAGERYRVFLPPRHKAMLEEIYDRLGVVRLVEDPDRTAPVELPDESSLELNIKGTHKTAVITVRAAGRDLDRRVKAKRMELADKGFNTIFLDLQLRDPATPEATGMVEAVGFFFSGLLPDFSDGDVLRLQYCITEVFYDEIQTYSDFAVEIKGYVKNLDPKWKARY